MKSLVGKTPPATSIVRMPVVKVEFDGDDSASFAPELPALDKHEGGAIGVGDDALDPKDLKKQRRLVRNRMSAQLHRERKKAYIDQLEAEIKQRDSIISSQKSFVEALQRENAQLRELLAAHGVAEGALPAALVAPVYSSDTGATSLEDSGGDSEGSSGCSEGSRTPPPPSSSAPSAKKRGAAGSVPAAKRMAPGSLLAALACLFVFRSPATLFQTFLAPTVSHLTHATPPSASVPWVPVAQPIKAVSSGPVRQGRILMSFDEESIPNDTTDSTDAEGADDSRALSLTVARPSLKNPKYSLQTNASYLMCPSTLQTGSFPLKAPRASGVPLNASQAPRPHHDRRSLRAQAYHGDARPDPRADPRGRAVVPAQPLEHGAQMRSEISVAITRMLLAKPKENETTSETADSSSSLVVRDPTVSNSKYQSLPGEDVNSGDEGVSPYLMLVVPSSTLEGFSSFEAGSNWVEIGCRMHSARFIDF